MSFFEFICVALAPSVTLGLMIFLAKNWFLSRLQSSIKHEYDVSLEKLKVELKSEKDKELEDLKALLKFRTDVSLEDYRYQVETKKRAELVAKLLALWLSNSVEKVELNQMAFECYLWLPDKIAINLADLLAHQRGAEVTVKTVLIDIRKHLNKGVEEYQALTNEDLTSFRY